jgi:hypothetical protein
MNHRCSVRIPLRVEVKLSQHGNLLGIYMTQNIDCEGAFVESRGLALHPNEILQLEVRLPRGKPSHIPVKAMVVRNTATGVGLLFTESSPELARQIGTLIQEFLDLDTSRSATRRLRAVG